MQTFLSQKGQGLVEYALPFSFVGAIFIFVFATDGFKASVQNVFAHAGNKVDEAAFDYENPDDVFERNLPAAELAANKFRRSVDV